MTWASVCSCKELSLGDATCELLATSTAYFLICHVASIYHASAVVVLSICFRFSGFGYHLVQRHHKNEVFSDEHWSNWSTVAWWGSTTLRSSSSSLVCWAWPRHTFSFASCRQVMPPAVDAASCYSSMVNGYMGRIDSQCWSCWLGRNGDKSVDLFGVRLFIYSAPSSQRPMTRGQASHWHSWWRKQQQYVRTQLMIWGPAAGWCAISEKLRWSKIDSENW